MSNLSTREQALVLARAGALIINIPARTKGPRGQNWPALATSDEAVINAWFDSDPLQNYGVMGVAEVGAVVGLDVDNPDLIEIIESETGEPFPTTLHVKTSKPEPGGHYYFRQTEKSVALGNCAFGKNFEWRAHHLQVVGPGSIHPSGIRYEAEDINAEILPIPDYLVDWMADYRTSNRERGLSSDIKMTDAEMEADVQGKLNWLVQYLNRERKNKDNPQRPVVYSKAPIRHTLSGLRGYKIYVRCPAKKEHSMESGITEACVMTVPGIGLVFHCAHSSHDNPKHDWNWYRKMTEAVDDLSDSVIPPRIFDASPIEDIMQPLPVMLGRERSDTGNTMRLRDRFGDKIRAVGGKFYIWDGCRWKLDAHKVLLHQMVSKTNSLIKDEASLVEAKGDDENSTKAAEAVKQALVKWSVTSGNYGHIVGVVNLASKATGIACVENPFDTDEWLLNVKNGTLDLRTQTLHPHCREDMQSKMANVVYDPSATCPTWDAFLNRVMAGDQEMVKFLARAIGYSLTGSVIEEVTFINWGTGANGKTTFTETWGRLLGEDYAHSADLSLLTKKKFGESGIPTDVAALAGKRMVLLSETEQHERLNEAKLKKLCSNERVTARKLYEDPSSFKSVHKLFLATNHKPLVVGTDNGLWRRLLLIAWEVTIPPEEQNKNIQEDLAREYSGILNWALRGLADYLAHGLFYPDKVVAATSEFRDESNSLKNFIEEKCDCDPEFKTRSGDLYAAYKKWASENKEYTVKSKEFKDRLDAMGYTWKRTAENNIFCGLRLKDMAL